ncbi:MAG: hypothetical protein JXM70_04015 [Pirellulales bacterium]|nr:hypothetical protein [Pirellulales bacterium]
MSMFENDNYRWRETYFVQFDKKKRPTLEQVQKRLTIMGDQCELATARADEDGRFESLTIIAHEDFAALDISYIEGDEVLEQGEQFAAELTGSECECEVEEAKKLALLEKYDGRFDVLHFEQVTESGEREDPDEMLDPSSLLLVLDILVDMTDGVAVDPQCGTLM